MAFLSRALGIWRPSRDVAQLVERNIRNTETWGPSPLISPFFGPAATHDGSCYGFKG